MAVHRGAYARKLAAIACLLVAVIGLGFLGASYYKYYQLRRAVDILRFADTDDVSVDTAYGWATEYVASHGRSRIQWLVREAAVTPGSLVPRALYRTCQPTMKTDPTDPGEPLVGLLPSIPFQEYTLREIAVYRSYAANQPEYVDFLISVIEEAPDRRQGWIPARIAISSLNVAANKDFGLPTDEWRYVDGSPEEDAERRAERRAMLTTENTLAEIREWWLANRATWKDYCRERDVSGILSEIPTRFTDSEIWDEALKPNRAQRSVYER